MWNLFILIFTKQNKYIKHCYILTPFRDRRQSEISNEEHVVLWAEAVRGRGLPSARGGRRPAEVLLGLHGLSRGQAVRP